MSQSNRKESLLGSLVLAAGVVIGVGSTLLALQNRPKKPGLVLEDVHDYFQGRGQVVGSWIDYDPIAYELFDSQPLVYIGGITLSDSEGLTRYQFACDAYTGHLLDYFKLP